MGWKNWSYLLRGGVIGGIVSIFMIFFMLLTAPLTCGVDICPPANLIETISANLYSLRNIIPGFVYLHWLTIIIIFSVVGALIGWIVGKIKSK